MFIHYKQKITRNLIRVLAPIAAVFVAAVIFTSNAIAEPYLALRNNQKCSACHVNPLGGGARTAFGAYYGSQVLPANAGSQDKFDGGQITETFRLGADLRANLDILDNDADQEIRSFNTQSGQIYVALQPKDSKFMLYFDEQIAPGGALNREAWGLVRLGKTNHYVKAGTIFLPFGYRFEDDTAFVRQLSGVTFDNNDTGGELGLEFEHGTLNFAMTNGTSGLSNDDTSFKFTSRGEYVGNNIRAGASVMVNDREPGALTNFAVFGGFNVWKFNVIGEFGFSEDEAILSPADNESNLIKMASLFEINYEVVKGYNIKFTNEWLDEDTEIDENERSRNSFLLEATPYANVQFRGGVRIGEFIPQNGEGNFTQLFAQMHIYY